jgi:hypothetical protein
MRQRSTVELGARVENEARKLALSGQYFSHRSIQLALVARGFVEAPVLFCNPLTCAELDRLCAQAVRERAARPV